MNASLWDPEFIKNILAKPADKEYKYIITDDKDEFLTRLESGANLALKSTKDNLRYIEKLDKIRQVREGADIFEVFPWLKKDKDNA